MADGNGAVAGLPFLGKHGGNGFTHDIASADDNAVFPAGLDVVALDQFKDTGRCGRGETGHSDYFNGKYDQ